MSEPTVIQVEDTGSVQSVPIGTAIVVDGVQIPSLSARRLDHLQDVDGADEGLAGQALIKGVDGIWRPGNVGGGGGPAGLVFTQNTPAATWVITHNLGRFPQITVVDSDGNRILPDLEYGSVNDVTLTHAEPLTGAAYIS